ncbi:MAG: hypothetical protein LBC40_02160, partial [Dysgonamonadaceae bacterium]|jgi:hypothetical protein|nr:hypothetical protein [Dysgonamonadaceae bacterium]
MSLRAQTGKDTLLTREVMLEKEYNPTIRDASRINTLPEIVEPTVPKTRVNYANYALPFDVQPQLSILKANEWFASVKESGKRGYAVAGIATNLNFNGDLGYQILLEENTKLNIFYTHRSANDRVSYLQEDAKQRMKLNDNLAGLDFSHAFEPFTLSARLKYTDFRYNYYGYDGRESPFTPTSLPPSDKTTNQRDNLLNIDLGAISSEGQAINYRINLNIGHFQQKHALLSSPKKPRETFIHTDLDANTTYGDMLLGLGAYFNVVSCSNTRFQEPMTGNNYFVGYDSYGQLSLNPYTGYDGDSWKAHIGAKSHFYINHGKKVFSLAPDIALSVLPFPDSEIYLTVNGGITTNTKQSLFETNRYLSPFFRPEDSRDLLDALIGWKNSIAGSYRLDLYAGYRITKDEHFFVPAYYSLPPYDNAGIYFANNAIAAEIMDANLFKAGMKATYQYQDRMEAGLKIQYNNWDIKNAANRKAWNRPVVEADLNAACTFNIPLRLDLVYHLETGRKTPEDNRTAGFHAQKMKDIHALTLSANYTFNDTFSVFAQGNNLLFQKYDLRYGYPAQSAHLMCGGSIKF